MKKFIMAVSAAVLLVSTFNAAAKTDITVSVDGKGVEFDQPPVIDNDRTLVPMRAIFEALGAEVSWDTDTRTVTSTKGDTEISLAIDSDKMTVGDKTVMLDVPAKIIGDRTMVPVRAISEAMSCKVDWDGEARAVIITTANTLVTEAPKTAPESTSESSAEPETTELPYAEAITIDIKDDTNIFDTAWIIKGKEIVSKTGETKDNEKLCATDFVPVNEGKSYYAGYYDPNNFKFVNGCCINYAFYDADKKYISGANADMAKTVKAPEYASYVRYTIKLTPDSERAMLYLTFMQTDKAPTEFVKSDAAVAMAETELFKGKKVFIVGDQQVQNAGIWTKLLDERLGANVISVKGIANLRYLSSDRNSISTDKITSTFPTDADYMIIAVGFADWMNSYDMGSDISSSGGVYDFMDTVKLKWPKTKVLVMTLPAAQYAADGFTGAGIYNNRGMDTQDYSDQIKDACERSQVPVIDVSKLWDRSDLKQYMKESNLSYLYPNEEGGQLIADLVYTRLVEEADK